MEAFGPGAHRAEPLSAGTRGIVISGSGSRRTGVDQLVQVEPVGVFCMKATGFADENLSERRVDAPVLVLVSVNQAGPANVAVDAHRVSVQAVAQTCFFLH